MSGDTSLLLQVAHTQVIFRGPFNLYERACICIGFYVNKRPHNFLLLHIVIFRDLKLNKQ